MSIDTGEVLDVHYMCSICSECSKWDDKTSPEYLEWFLSHEMDCMLNHDGSAQSMETEGVSILFNRSVQKYNLRYNPFIGDRLEWVDMRYKWNFRAGCIEQIFCGYMYTRVRVPSKEKTRGMPGTDMYLSCPSNS